MMSGESGNSVCRGGEGEFNAEVESPWGIGEVWCWGCDGRGSCLVNLFRVCLIMAESSDSCDTFSDNSLTTTVISGAEGGGAGVGHLLWHCIGRGGQQ